MLPMIKHSGTPSTLRSFNNLPQPPRAASSVRGGLLTSSDHTCPLSPQQCSTSPALWQHHQYRGYRLHGGRGTCACQSPSVPGCSTPLRRLARTCGAYTSIPAGGLIWCLMLTGVVQQSTHSMQGILVHGRQSRPARAVLLKLAKQVWAMAFGWGF